MISLSDFRYTVRRYRNTFGCWPNLFYPTTFSEKITYKKLFNRDPLLTRLADKFSVREYVAERVGNAYLPELLFVTDCPAAINFTLLPNSFVIKATHGSGWDIIIKDKANVDTLAIRQQLSQWLRENYYYFGREWCYKNIQPQIIIEEFLSDESGSIPYDYKFFCFNGTAKIIQVDVDRFENHKRNLYDTNWEKLNIKLMYQNFEFPLPAPNNLTEMIFIAEKLSAGLDFVRVDLYNIGGTIYFGELTHYPGNGFERFEPKEYDKFLGTYWR